MKTLVIMAGLPASGKSTYIKNNLQGFDIVDCDELKKSINGYDPMNPQLVHAQSKVLEKSVIYKNFHEGISFVYDTTASNTDNVIYLINTAHELGYTVHVVHISVSLDTALYRNARRERVVPEDVIIDKYGKMSTSINIIKKYVDGFIELDNN